MQSEYMASPSDKKILALAFANVITTTNPMILELIPSFIQRWLLALSETEEDETGG
jgi:hypothetical protein